MGGLNGFGNAHESPPERAEGTPRQSPVSRRRGVGARRYGVAGTWAGALLHQGKQLSEGGPGELSAERRGGGPGQIRGLGGEAQPHEVAIGHDDVAETLWGMADRDDREV